MAPTLTLGTLGGAVSLPAGNTLYSWGSNGTYRTAQGADLGHTTTPTQVSSVASDTGWTQLEAGDAWSAGIRDGKLFTWGSNSSGKTGQGTTSGTTNTPTQVGTGTDWDYISVSLNYAFGIRNGGELWAWGENGYYSLGDGTNTDRTTPVQIGSNTDWEYVHAGSAGQSFGIRGGALYGWGSNAFYALGDGTNTDRTTPVQIGTETDWTMVVGGGPTANGFSNGIRNGLLFGWGNGTYYAHGGDTTSNLFTPYQLRTTSNWTFVAVGTYSGSGLRAGELHSWGYNSEGRTGRGTTALTSTRVPTRIGSDSNWETLANGDASVNALKNGGELWAWGRNGDYQAGNGGDTNLASPTRIGSDTWELIASGTAHSTGAR